MKTLNTTFLKFLLFNLLLIISPLSYGFGMNCTKPVISTPSVDQSTPFSFDCVNTTGVTFGSYSVTPVVPEGVTATATACTGPVAPNAVCSVDATVTPFIPGSYSIDFNDFYGGETHYGIFCNNPSKGCIEFTTTIPGTPGAFEAAACTTGICVALGTASNSPKTPFVYQSLDGGYTWNAVTVAGISNSVTFTSANCVGSNENAYCVAVGLDSITSRVLLIQTRNGGSTWSQVSTASFPSNSEFFDVDCSDDAAICVAAGFVIGSSPLVPVLAQTTDAGATWVPVTITGSPGGRLNGAACTGSGASAFCIAAGANLFGGPLLAQTIDQGGSWESITIGTSGNLFGAGCTGDNFCVGVGRNLVSGAALIVQSIDTGANWTIPAISDSPVLGQLFGADCVGSGVGAVCVAAGENLTSSAPLLVQTLNQGSNWGTKTITGVTSGQFTSDPNIVNCNATATQCIAVGQGAGSSPLLAQTIDSGNTWATVAISGGTATGRLNAAACMGSTTQCIAAGSNSGSGNGYLVQSLNQGATWTPVQD